MLSDLKLLVRLAVLLILLMAQIPKSHVTHAQILNDPVTIQHVHNTVNHIYNLEFAEASRLLRQISLKYPGHPVPYLLKGIIIYWQYFPLVPGTPHSTEFIETMQHCYALAETKIKEKHDDPEYLLSGLGSIGMLLLYHADNGQTRNVVSLAPKAYSWAMKAFAYTHTFKDFYFITGLYNYYREAYTDVHPVYKPVVVFFPGGDKAGGLRQLKVAADSALFLKAEAYTFLSGIYQGYEHNYSRALFYSRRLKNSFANNTQFRFFYIKDLLINRRYHEAEQELDSIRFPASNEYYMAQHEIYRAIVREKKYHDHAMAERLYFSGIRRAGSYGTFGNRLAAIGYFGLARVYTGNDEKRMKRYYLKQGNSLADYKHINFN